MDRKISVKTKCDIQIENTKNDLKVEKISKGTIGSVLESSFRYEGIVYVTFSEKQVGLVFVKDLEEVK